MDDIETDGCDSNTKMSNISCDDRIDSGLCSITDSAFGSLIEEKCVSKELDDINQKNITDVSRHLSEMTIDPENYDNKCDSGLDIIVKHDSLEENKELEYFWTSSNFSPQQVVEIFRGDEDGDNHLHLSIIHGLPQVTMQIIGLAPYIDWLNQTNSLLQTPLHIAVITRQTTVVRRLICAGASIDVRDQLGNTPLHTACRLGYDDVVRMLMVPVRLEETWQNKYDIPHQKFPQDLESRNYEGLTCLHLAAIGEHLHVMQILLSHGANVNTAEGKSGRTILHLAAEWGNMDLLRFVLSQKGVNINTKTYAGLTPYILALGRQHLDIVHELGRRGCEVLALSEDSDGENSDEEMAEEDSILQPFKVQAQRSHPIPSYN